MARIVMLIALAFLACGDGDKQENKQEKAPAPTVPPEVDPGSAATAPGIPECNEVFAFVRDKFLTCEKIPQMHRDLMRSSMGSLNLAVRQGMALSSDSKRAEMVEACKKGLASAREDYEENCK